MICSWEERLKSDECRWDEIVELGGTREHPKNQGRLVGPKKKQRNYSPNI